MDETQILRYKLNYLTFHFFMFLIFFILLFYFTYGLIQERNELQDEVLHLLEENKKFKQAVLEDLQDLDNLINSLDENSSIEEVLTKLKIHRKIKLRRF